MKSFIRSEIELWRHAVKESRIYRAQKREEEKKRASGDNVVQLDQRRRKRA